ncbi:amidohydrolase family protein [Duganella sp. FT94W]|uniref:Amidohydrolase family protein n=1 Tax=Duganella lactea TaxID=2692173 RepID=A0ABW9V488_9BURK|nr:amidohydrolase family protein [Duganella lactea]MYM34363.1 amidohydrolase family protein [Duganella lactea]
MRIDIHGHIVERAYYDELEALPGVTIARRDGGMGALKRDGKYWLPFRDAWFDLDEQLRDMDRKGIDMRILSLSTPSVYPFPAAQRAQICRQQNDTALAFIRQHPSRFRLFATLPLPDAKASLEELERVIQFDEVVGITIGSNIDGMALSDPALEPIWARLNELRLPVFEHPMVPVFGDAMDEFALTVRVGFMLDTSLAMARMIYAGVFERYPDFPFIVGHTGNAFLGLLERLDNGFRNYAECQQHITRLPSEFAKKFYYDTCSFYTPAIMMAREIVGNDRLLFGTDYPFIDRGAEHVEALPLAKEDIDLILGGNARRLLKL